MVQNLLRRSISLAILVLSLVAAGCRSSGPAPPALTGPEWQEATSASGNYVAEFPGKAKAETQQVPGSDLSISFTTFESGGDAFTLSETALNGVAPYPLDDAVDGAVESARAGQEAEWGAVTATERSRTTGDFEGVETRRFSYDLAGGDEKVTMSALIFYRDDVIVQAIMVSDEESDAEAADRFLSSVKTAG